MKQETIVNQLPLTEEPTLPKGETRWRVFAGDLETRGRVHLDQGGLEWEPAKDLLLTRILPWLADSCPCCREAAMECLHELDDPTAHGQAFHGDIGTTQYILAPEDE